MSNVLVAVSLEETIAELAEVRARKAELSERESEIRSLVLDTVAKQPTQILNGNGDLIAEVTLSERRSINSWDDFETKFPEAIISVALQCGLHLRGSCVDFLLSICYQRTPQVVSRVCEYVFVSNFANPNKE